MRRGVKNLRFLMLMVRGLFFTGLFTAALLSTYLYLSGVSINEFTKWVLPDQEVLSLQERPKLDAFSGLVTVSCA